MVLVKFYHLYQWWYSLGVCEYFLKCIPMQPSYNLYMHIYTNLMNLKSATHWMWVKAHQEGKSPEIWINNLSYEHANVERESTRGPR